jgi:hypothetical protein
MDEKMLGKAVDTTWKIGVDVAAKVLVGSINHYYGW